MSTSCCLGWSWRWWHGSDAAAAAADDDDDGRGDYGDDHDNDDDDDGRMLYMLRQYPLMHFTCSATYYNKSHTVMVDAPQFAKNR